MIVPLLSTVCRRFPEAATIGAAMVAELSFEKVVASPFRRRVRPEEEEMLPLLRKVPAWTSIRVVSARISPEPCCTSPSPVFRSVWKPENVKLLKM